MAYEFSFDTRQWWATIAACVLVVLLAFAAGFLAGVMWGRRGGPLTRADGRTVPVSVPRIGSPSA